MGRPRSNRSQGLPAGVYLKGGTFYTVIQNKWIKLGRDLDAAAEKAKELREGAPVAGTIAYWYDQWLLVNDARLAAGDMAKRTHHDYAGAKEFLMPFFGSMIPTAVVPKHIGDYLDIGKETGRTVRVNRERAAFSAFMTWMVRKENGGVLVNPCFGVNKNTEVERSRYIEDAEYNAVFKISSAPVRAMMVLMYRTLQRPEDILSWTYENISTKPDGSRVVSFKAGKAGRAAKELSIVLNREIEDALQDVRNERDGTKDGVRAQRLRAVLADPKRAAKLPLISSQSGERYTLGGLRSMFNRHVEEAGIKDYAIYDHKAKGATDMLQSGTPIAEISALCDHKSIRTTEIYIKRHAKKEVRANARVIPETSKTPEPSPGKERAKKAKVLEDDSVSHA